MAQNHHGPLATAGLESLRAGRVLIGLLVAAAISGVLVPAIAQSWQNHQRELDIKSALVSNISLSTARLIGAVDNFEANPTTDLSRYNNAYLTWLNESQAESAQLSAYALSSGNNQVVSDWRSFSESMKDFYLLSVCPSPDRSDLLSRMRGNLTHLLRNPAAQEELQQENAQEVDWTRLDTCYEFFTAGDPYTTDWINLRNQVTTAKDTVIAEIVEAHLLPGPCILRFVAC